MLNKLKARKSQLQAKGGFTLVELIVVLVILAILAALLIPALTGYIDKANEKKVVSQTRQLVMAAQTLTSEAYGAGVTKDYTYAPTGTEVKTDKTITNEEMKRLSEVNAGNKLSLEWTDSNVTKAVYNDGTYTCTFENDAYTTKKNP